jgi:hypothetical protein
MAKQSFTVGQVLTAAQLTSLQQTAMLGGAASAKTTSYTLVAADAGTAISMTSTSATTITVNTGLFAAGDTVQITNLGSGVATITAGTATVNAYGSLALAQYESGTLDFNSSSAAIFFKTGGGKVLQVVSTAKTDTFSSSSTSYTDITGLSVAITPTSSTSKIYVMCTINGTSANGQLGFFQLMRDSTAIGIGDTAGSRTRSSFSSNLGRSLQQATDCMGINFLDSPATTSATTYKVQLRSTSGNIYINRSGDDGDFNYYARTISSITVMEIGA